MIFFLLKPKKKNHLKNAQNNSMTPLGLLGLGLTALLLALIVALL
jgi:succinate-acetate transporter protein